MQRENYYIKRWTFHLINGPEGDLYSYGRTQRNCGRHIYNESYEVWRFNMRLDRWCVYQEDDEQPELAGKFATPYGDEKLFCLNSNILKLFSIREKKWIRLKTSENLSAFAKIDIISYKDDLFLCSYACSDSLNIYFLCHNSNQWKPFSETLPYTTTVFNHKIVIYGESVYVIPGVLESNNSSIIKIPRFDLEAKAWFIDETHIESGKEGLLKKRFLYSLSQKDEVLYVSGGTDGTVKYSHIWELNLKTKMWRILSVYLRSALTYHTTTLSDDGSFLYICKWETESHLEKLATYYIMIKIPKLEELAIMSLRCILSQNSAKSMGMPNSIYQRLRG